MVRNSRVKLLVVSLMMGFILVGCCSSSIVYREVKIPVPAIVVKDTVSAVKIDSFYTGTILTETGDTAVSATFYPQKEKFEIKYIKVPDTVTVSLVDTIEVPDLIIKGDSIWEKAIYMTMGLLTAAIVWYIKRKRNANLHT